jgi:type I restriction enzyme S subunit
MMERLYPYPEMKRTGMSWLPTIPVHWQVRRNGRLFGIRKETGYPDLPVLEVSLHTGVRVRNFENGRRKQRMTDRSKYQRALRGDIAYNMMRMWQGAVGVVPTEGLVSPAYIVARPFSETIARYYAYLFRTAAYMREVEIYSRGIVPDRNRLYWESFKQISSVYPPSEEQRAIATFLDWHSGLTAKAIRAKQAVIELLEEQKQAVIHRLVTQGIDPTVRLKPSGFAWLGDIPEHWKVVRLRNLIHHVTSGSRGWSRYASDAGPLFIRIGNLTRSSLDVELETGVRLNLPKGVNVEADRTRIQPDDILLSITAYIGSVAVVPPSVGEAYVSQHVACCRPKKGAANPKWLGYVLLSPVGQTHGILCMYGGTKQGLSLDDVKNYVILLPPAREQGILVARIESDIGVLNGVIRSIHCQIALYREFRHRLITDVVTGKLDVRAAAASLPGTAKEIAALGERKITDDQDYPDGEEPEMEEAVA